MNALYWYVCEDCGAGRGVPCDTGCPGDSHARELLDDDTAYDPALDPAEVLPGGGWAL